MNLSKGRWLHVRLPIQQSCAWLSPSVHSRHIVHWWAHISLEEKNKGYLPCVPAVVIELMSATDKIEDLQAKVTKITNCGTVKVLLLTHDAIGCGSTIDTSNRILTRWHRLSSTHGQDLRWIALPYETHGYKLDWRNKNKLQTIRKMQTVMRIYSIHELMKTLAFLSKKSCCIIESHFVYGDPRFMTNIAQIFQPEWARGALGAK
jgi:hypothetical protein